MGERLNLSYNSRHLAIYFMDYLLDNEEISIQKLQFYGITSLMLSGKNY